MSLFPFCQLVDDITEDEQTLIDVGSLIADILFVESFTPCEIDETKGGLLIVIMKDGDLEDGVGS